MRRPLLLICAFLLLFAFTGSSTLMAIAATVSDPDNSLYGVKVWEQHVQLSLANSPQDRADVSLHIIRDRLNVIPSLTDAAHAKEYQQALDTNDNTQSAQEIAQKYIQEPYKAESTRAIVQ